MIDRLPPISEKTGLGIAGGLAFLVLILWLPVGLYRTPKPDASPYVERDLSSFKDELGTLAPIVTERPIFDRSRRPLKAPEAAPKAEVTLQLVGVLTDGTERTALIRLSNAPTLYRLQAGENLGDWTVKEITENEIVVKKRGENEQRISLSN